MRLSASIFVAGVMEMRHLSLDGMVTRILIHD